MPAKFAKYQPRNGETILYCPHPNVRPQHFYTFGEGAPALEWKWPDGRVSHNVRFMALCQGCHDNLGFRPRTAITKEGEWIGHEPVIRENFS